MAIQQNLKFAAHSHPLLAFNPHSAGGLAPTLHQHHHSHPYPLFKKMTNDTVYTTLNGAPKELLDDVIDSIPHANLKQCSLVRKCWVYQCQEQLFKRFMLSAQMTEWWTKPVRENQPLLFLYIKRLTLVGVYLPDWMDVNSA